MESKTLGGDRLGSGKKMKVQLHNYERSTHDLGYVWRSTMAAGTLVPFMCEVALPGDTFDINLGADGKTHPTIGPLFGSYKMQLDVFIAPIRLYQAQLHNNTLGIGRNMSAVKLPQIKFIVDPIDTSDPESFDINNCQINPSSLLAYLGIRGFGTMLNGMDPTTRSFNAIPILAYHEIYKNYYSNKQEEIGAVLHTPSTVVNTNVSGIARLRNVTLTTIVQAPLSDAVVLVTGDLIRVVSTGAPTQSDIIFYTDAGELTLDEITTAIAENAPGDYDGIYDADRWGGIAVYNWRYRDTTDVQTGKPEIATFPLENIDQMRKAILTHWTNTPFELNTPNIEPYNWLYERVGTTNNVLSSQEGLLLKTYQSDQFNNWLKTENIDAISTATAIDTSGGSFTIDQLILSKKVYQMLNRINVSGGSYDDWQDAVYMHDRYIKCESPMYMGGLIKELVFQEVVSNSESESGQPLGTLAGKGTMSGKHKGGTVIVKVDEPSYIIGIVSLTPRIDYSQGNKWDVNLKTMDDFHKPALDEIGFQELITEQMAWWDTQWNGTEWTQKSAGKQPAWLNYMTNVNRTYGNFAIEPGGLGGGEMFMTLNRKYEAESIGGGGLQIADLTTYIDPSKYNNIFAEQQLDAQNFWVQIAVDITARRKMSAKIMPNL